MSVKRSPSPPTFNSKKPILCLTQVNVVKFQFLWTISNYSFCSTDEYIRSLEFSDGVKDHSKWYLKLYPNGRIYEDGYRIFVSLLLHLDSKIDVRAAYTFSVLDINGEQLNIFNKEVYTHIAGTDSGNNCFIKRDILLNTQKYLPNDTLTILAEISVLDNILHNTVKYNEVKVLVPKCRLSNDIGSLLKSEKFSDVTMFVDGQELKVHSIILAARSPVFAAMFNNQMKESELKQIFVTDIGYKVVKEMLKFIYTGKSSQIESMADELLAAAEYYGLERLKAKCELILVQKLSVKNVVHMFTLATLHSANQLKIQTIQFIKTNRAKVKNSIDWSYLGKSDVQELLNALLT